MDKKYSSRTKDILVEKVKRDINTSIQPMHFHPYYEIGYVVSGKRQMTIDHDIFSLERGDLVLVNKEAVHKGSSVARRDEYIEWIGLYFSDDYIKPFVECLGIDNMMGFFNSGVIKIPSGRREHVEELFGKMMFEYEKRDEMSTLLVRCYFEELFAFLYRLYKNGDTDKTKISPDDELIAKAAEYMYKNFAKDITLEDVAYKYNMSKSHFSKKFKAVTGCGFKEYLISVRLKEACRLLIDTSRSITDIALDCGFSDSNYFGDAFKKIKGMSPKQYRKNM